MHQFYSTNIEADEILLSEEESKHCTRVLRLGVGDNVVVFDGKGGEYQCQIIDDGRQVRLAILKQIHEPSEPTWKLTIAVSPTKSADRMEWMLEKLVEIGLYRIVFIQTEKGERARLNVKRLHKKAVSAMKQSGNRWLPLIETEVRFKDFLSWDVSETKYIAHCFEKEKSDIKTGSKTASVSMLIGPEGDFSMDEVNRAISSGYQPVSLGLQRYRTETAALVAGTLLNHFCVTLAAE